MGLFLHQTTTGGLSREERPLLFMGLFLHQTTTSSISSSPRNGCLWVFSYIKPQPWPCAHRSARRCLWVFSYIKPQLAAVEFRVVDVVYGSFPTSNHNWFRGPCTPFKLFMGLFLHQTTTLSSGSVPCSMLFMGLFLHQTTTSVALTLP